MLPVQVEALSFVGRVVLVIVARLLAILFLWERAIEHKDGVLVEARDYVDIKRVCSYCKIAANVRFMI